MTAVIGKRAPNHVPERRRGLIVAQMQALAFSRYGGPETMELRHLPVPTPGAGEVLIRVHAAGLNPIDYKLREGQMRAIYRYRLPVIAGNELSGVVADKGSGVTGFNQGDRVFTRVDKANLGAFAEYATVRANLVARMPSNIDFSAAAGVPLAGLTALQTLRDELHVKAGDHIFISGGAGGVGSFALQLAARFGAHVATTASARNAEKVRRLGAAIVIDYDREHFDQILSEYDGALDLIGGESLTKTFGVVRRGARVVSIAGVPEPQTAKYDLNAGPLLAMLFWAISLKIRRNAKKHGVSYRYFLMHPSGSDLSDLASLIDRRELEVVVDRVFPFEQIPDAFEYLERGHARGKVIVQMVHD